MKEGMQMPKRPIKYEWQRIVRKEFKEEREKMIHNDQPRMARKM